MNAEIMDKEIKNNLYVFTKRELDVLNLIAKGLNNIEIANILNISTHTAKVHVASILRKMEAKSRLVAVIQAIKLNII